MSAARRAERVLVTGAAGFIGSTLVDRLLAEGRHVVGVDNFDPFYPEAEKQRNLAAALQHPNFRLERADIRDGASMQRVLAATRFDGIAHLAALAGVTPSLERPIEYADVNVRGTAVLLDAAARAGRPVFVLASSSSVYGERTAGPFRESDRVDHPISPYAATKKACELLAHSFFATAQLPVTCVRFFTAYGPRQRPDLAIRKFADRMRLGLSVPVYGDGAALLRDFTYVDDVVDGLVRALDTDLGYAVLNFGAGRQVSLLEVVAELERALGVRARIDSQPRQLGNVSQTWADISAARAALGYAPKLSFAEGITRFVAWLKESS